MRANLHGSAFSLPRPTARFFIAMGERRETLKAFYNSTAWAKARDLAIRRDRFLCVDCLKQGKVVPAAEVHHIVPVEPWNMHDSQVTLNLDNLVSLCLECHRKRHGIMPRRYKVDAWGRVTIK